MNNEFNRQKKLVEKLNTNIINSLNIINESGISDKKKSAINYIRSSWQNTKKSIQTPDDVIQWYNDNNKYINSQLKNPDLPPNVRKMLIKCSNYMNYAVNSDINDDVIYKTQQNKFSIVNFIKKHWFKILVLIFLISLFCTGGSIALATPEVASAIAASELAGVGKTIEFTVGGFAYIWNVLMSILGYIPGLKTIFQKLII